MIGYMLVTPAENGPSKPNLLTRLMKSRRLQGFQRFTDGIQGQVQVNPVNYRKLMAQLEAH